LVKLVPSRREKFLRHVDSELQKPRIRRIRRFRHTINIRFHQGFFRGDEFAEKKERESYRHPGGCGKLTKTRSPRVFNLTLKKSGTELLDVDSPLKLRHGKRNAVTFLQTCHKRLETTLCLNQTL
jgi:hypothetical protein